MGSPPSPRVDELTRVTRSRQREARHALDLDFRMPDYGLGGFFPQLRTANDLFAKLERDFERLKANPTNAEVAYDFYVTANHLVDWKWPNDAAKQSSMRKGDAIPRICQHLANGAKHFSLNQKHDAVQHADTVQEVFDPNTFDPGTFQAKDELMIEFGPTEAAELGVDRLNAVVLADKVIQYWKPRL